MTQAGLRKVAFRRTGTSGGYFKSEEYLIESKVRFRLNKDIWTL